MEVIDRHDLLARLALTAPAQLVHGSGIDAFARRHIPGSLAFTDPGLATSVLRRSDPVVVYGTDQNCQPTRDLVATLAAHGYVVLWYRGGLTDWDQAGLPTEGTSPPTTDLDDA